jgi:hypothetical protein
MPGTPVPKRACRLEQFGLINGSIHSYPASSINAFWPPRATLRHSYAADGAHPHWVLNSRDLTTMNYLQSWGER